MASKHRAWRLILIFVAVPLAAILGAAWWGTAHWGPDRADWPVQGVWIDGRHDAAAVLALAEGADGGPSGPLPADFLYATASIGADGRNPHFAAQYERAQRSGLAFGAVHLFDPCIPADRQSANFVTIVPRGRAMLPPAVVLSGSGEECEPTVRPAEVESELVTFLNEIEMHAGRRAILAPSASFEAEYGFAAKSRRALWLSSRWREPGYAGGRWSLWTANPKRRIAGIDEPVGWVISRR